MIVTKIEVPDIKDVEVQLNGIKDKAPLVLSRAINRTVTNIKKNMGAEVSKGYFIKSGDVKKTLQSVNASKRTPKGMVLSSGSPIALSKFKVSPNKEVRRVKRGYSPKMYKASVKRNAGLRPLAGTPKAFLASMESGHKGVYVRKGSQRLPIKQLYGPSVPQMLKNKEIIDFINKEAGETLRKRIDAEVSNILRG